MADQNKYIQDPYKYIHIEQCLHLKVLLLEHFALMAITCNTVTALIGCITGYRSTAC